MNKYTSIPLHWLILTVLIWAYGLISFMLHDR